MPTTNQIIQSSLGLFMKYGVRSVSMDDLAQSLGISKKTIYNTFDSKEKLITKVIRLQLSRDEKDIRKITSESTDAIEEIVSISRHVLQFMSQIKPSLIFDLKKFYPDCWALIEKQHFLFIKQTIQNNIQRGQREGLYRPDIHSDVVAKLYVGKSNLIVNQDIFPPDQYELSELIREMARYHLFGVVSDQGKAKLLSIPNYPL